MERREAQGSRAEGPRAPGPPPPQGTLGSRNLGAFKPADRKAGEGSLASSTIFKSINNLAAKPMQSASLAINRLRPKSKTRSPLPKPLATAIQQRVEP